MANFEAFHWVISSSINLLFLKSVLIIFRSNGRDGFGIHAINCTQHPYGDIGLSEMEQTLQAKYGDFSKYDAFMDDNMGFWANDLDPYVKAFQVSTIDMFFFKYNTLQK